MRPTDQEIATRPEESRSQVRVGLPLAWALALLAVCAAPPRGAAQDWPMRRHDSQRLAYQPTGVDIDVPGVIGTMELGGAVQGRTWLLGDADGDGADEVYVVGGGRLMAWRPDGVLRWATPPLNLTQIIALDDLDGDGRQEVFAAGAQVSPTAFDALTGERLWQAPTPAGQYVGDVIPFDIDGDGQRELIVSDWGGATGGHGTARVYRFPEGLRLPASTTALDTSAHGYWFGLGLGTGDLAGDGRTMLVTASNDRIIAYDLATGAPAFSSPALGDFPYGAVKLHVADIDGDGRDEVVVASDNAGGSNPVAKRLMVLAVDGADLVVRWDLVVDPTAGAHRFIRGNVAMLQAGSSPSIVTSVFDPGLGHWRTLVFAGTSSDATPVVILEDRVILALADVDGDGVSEALTLDTPTGNVPAFGHVRALSLQADLSWTEKWSANDAQLAMARGQWSSSSSDPVRTSRGLLLQIDSDGDQRADQVVYGGGGAGVFATPPHVMVGDVETTSGTDAAGRVWLSMTDGRVARLDLGLEMTNDSAPSDGFADLLIGTYLAPPAVSASSSAGMLLAIVDATGAPAVFRPSTGLEPIWTGTDRVATPRPALTWLSGPDPSLTFPAREADGTLALVVRDGLTGEQRARYSYGPSVSSYILSDMVPLRAADGAVARVVTGLHESRSGQVSYVATDPLTGDMLPLDLGRELIGGEYPVTAHDVDGDGIEDALVVQMNRLVVASGADGSLILEHINPRGGGMMSFADLDGDGGLDVLHQGGTFRGAGYGARRLTADFSTEVWSIDQTIRHNPVGMAHGLDGSFHLGLSRQQEAWFSVVDAAGNPLATSIPAGGSVYPDMVSALAAGAQSGILTPAAGVAAGTAGRSASFAFGSTDGYLYSIHAEDGTFAWSLPFRTAVGEPIATDVTGDGHSEMVVAAGDGNLYLVGPARLQAPAEVFDNDGMSAAGSAAADVDELSASNRVGGDWSPVDGATGYEYQIVRDDDLVVLPWTDVGPETQIFFDALSLQVGPRYFGVVRAYHHAGAEVRVGPEARSDGFVVADTGAPEVLLSATPPVIWRAAEGMPTETQIHMEARDSVALSSYRLSAEAADGSTVRVFADGPAAGTERTLDVLWPGLDDSGAQVPAGRYALVGVATDTASHRAEARVDVTVCTRDAPAALGCLEPADAGPPDAGGTLAGGGGCGCHVGSDTSSLPASLLLLLAIGLPLARRRSR